MSSMICVLPNLDTLDYYLALDLLIKNFLIEHIIIILIHHITKLLIVIPTTKSIDFVSRINPSKWFFNFKSSYQHHERLKFWKSFTRPLIWKVNTVLLYFHSYMYKKKSIEQGMKKKGCKIIKSSSR
jgi:hypothetical protein